MHRSNRTSSTQCHRPYNASEQLWKITGMSSSACILHRRLLGRRLNFAPRSIGAPTVELLQYYHMDHVRGYRHDCFRAHLNHHVIQKLAGSLTPQSSTKIDRHWPSRPASCRHVSRLWQPTMWSTIVPILSLSFCMSATVGTVQAEFIIADALGDFAFTDSGVSHRPSPSAPCRVVRTELSFDGRFD